MEKLADITGVAAWLSDLAKQLNCSATAPGIIDAVTRLQEANARLTSDQAGPLAVMRRQADQARADLDSLVNDVYAAIDEGYGEPWRPQHLRTGRASMIEAVRALAAGSGDHVAKVVVRAVSEGTGREWRDRDPKEGIGSYVYELGRAWLTLGNENAQLKAEMLRDVDPVAVHEAAQHLAGGGGGKDDPDDVCEDCGEATCERCGQCLACGERCPAPATVGRRRGAAGHRGRSVDPAEPAGAPGLVAALESARTVLVTDSRDWLRADRPMSWLYGLLVGFSGDVMPDVARRHGWDAGVVERLLFMHAAVAAAMTPAGEE